MSENNKSYRIRTAVGKNAQKDISLNVNLLQDYDTLEILSLKIDTESLYKTHTSNYGCLVGRVLANGGVGVPNVKVSVFIEAHEEDLEDPILSYFYPYKNTFTRNVDKIRYNLLPDSKVNECHQIIGTFPNKRLVLDDDNVIEIYDSYYKFTTVTNASGDYMIFGLPVGNNILHSDLDLSDIGILSQKPRDLAYKGYGQTLFENPNMFKKDTNLDNLTQVMSTDTSVYVYPFWGDEEDNREQIKITRSDIDVPYKFEPTCIFIGSVVTDEKSNAVSKNCIPSERGGKMDRLTAGKGTIEMIRKDIHGDVESFSVQGNELIDGNGTWCYQIPMNLDYITTDEYGQLVPTDNTDIGLPTRTSVRFRVSVQNYESEYENTHLVKMLVPNNENVIRGGEKYTTDKIYGDYNFGTETKDENFRDLFWNNVYTVKSYIPRYQKGNKDRNKNFTGIKAVNVNGGNNPIPYNNMRVNLTFLFIFQCIIFKSVVIIVKYINSLIRIFDYFKSDSNSNNRGPSLFYITLDGAVCPQLEGHYVAPGARTDVKNKSNLIPNTYKRITGEEFNLDGDMKDLTAQTVYGTVTVNDPKSAEVKNNGNGTLYSGETYNEDGKTDWINIYYNEDYFIKCVELQFAMEYEVIQFDFYNDWLNGCLYIPRWVGEVRRNKENLLYCSVNQYKPRYFTQQCAIGYNENNEYSGDFGCDDVKGERKVCHKKMGRKGAALYRGIINRQQTMKGQYVYYPISNILTQQYHNIFPMFATDIVLLGSVEKNNIYGIPAINDYPSSTYIMPPPTGEIVSDLQEMAIKTNSTSGGTWGEHIRSLYTFNKTINATDNGIPELEVSGIDWGYNPFSPKINDDTTTVDKQVGGHFLEIGCTRSLTNMKTCANLTRICEIGSEASQSHEYYYKTKRGDDIITNIQYTKATGIVSKREVNNQSIRSAFASLNYNGLKTEINPSTNYKTYSFLGSIPNSFDGSLSNRNEISKLRGSTMVETFKENGGSVVETTMVVDYYLNDDKSQSYVNFRIGDDVNDRFLLTGTTNYIPKYKNSFYFYFGIKNGSTAIDRLYSEYYAPCIGESSIVLAKNKSQQDNPEDNPETPVTSANIIVFNSGVTLSGNKTFNVEFKCDGKDFTKIETVLNGIYYCNDDERINVYSGGWKNISYRTIVYKMPSESDFYEFIVNNSKYLFEFNDAIDTTSVNYNINFICDDVKYNQITISDGIISYKNAVSTVNVYTVKLGWTKECYRYVFTELPDSESGESSIDVYKYLNSNANKIAISETTYTLRSEITFGTTVSFVEYDDKFICNGRKYNKITIADLDQEIIYGQTVVYDNDGWKDDVYRTITCSNASQISKGFQKFINNNCQ